jgi:hypothetical protein
MMAYMALGAPPWPPMRVYPAIAGLGRHRHDTQHPQTNQGIRCVDGLLVFALICEQSLLGFLRRSTLYCACTLLLVFGGVTKCHQLGSI